MICVTSISHKKYYQCNTLSMQQHYMILSHGITWYYHTALHDVITLCHTTRGLAYHCGVVFSNNKRQIIRKLWWQAQLATHLLIRNLTSNRNKCGCINQCIMTPSSLILIPQHFSFYIKLLPSLSCSSPQLLPLLFSTYTSTISTGGLERDSWWNSWESPDSKWNESNDPSYTPTHASDYTCVTHTQTRTRTSACTDIDTGSKFWTTAGAYTWKTWWAKAPSGRFFSTLKDSSLAMTYSIHEVGSMLVMRCTCECHPMSTNVLWCSRSWHSPDVSTQCQSPYQSSATWMRDQQPEG